MQSAESQRQRKGCACCPCTSMLPMKKRIDHSPTFHGSKVINNHIVEFPAGLSNIQSMITLARLTFLTCSHMFLGYSTIMSNSWRSSVTSDGSPRWLSLIILNQKLSEPSLWLMKQLVLYSACSSVLNLGPSNVGSVSCATHCLLLGNIAGLQKEANNV